MRALLGLVLLSGCMVGTAPCDEAAAQLTSCSDDQREAFIDACEATGGAPDPAAFEDADTACKAVPASLAFGGVQDSAETGVCVAAMYAVKWAVTVLSPTAVPLSDSSKAILRPLYGSLVDDVRVSLGATLPPRIVFHGHELAVEAQAMTFGNQIFMLGEVATDTKTPYRLLLATVHEMRHAQQSQEAGGYYGFAVHYCRDMVAAHWNYNQIGLEVNAYSVQNAARRSLQTCGHVTCP
jgi:hypothetical protein